ncbi:two-component system cell cycle sensor histidine kinase PleC [Maritalea mobilis]|uniref:histidine kinase n=1 Tax=Maritalea mobilis TaxID=483324 RepID=A0A4R6VJZ8_9HYPH|nr:HAMP domain-containing sensor histidine kinase [Maritalea mobilis]TDQ63735.1 two-component system cell cycle sensor histidine kinase PleC [Maritalea mobilis]
MSIGSSPEANKAVRTDRGKSHQRAVNDARQRLTSSSGTMASYDFELLQEYAGTRLSGKYAMPVLIVAIALLTSIWVPLLYMLTWAAIVIVGHVSVMLSCKQFLKASQGKFNARRQTTTFVMFETIYGVGWSTIALLPISNAAQEVAVIQWAILLVGVAANAISSRAVPTATLANSVPGIITVGSMLVINGGMLNYALAVLAVGAGIFFNFLARTLHKSAIKSLEHRAEKDMLIFELEEAKSMSDEARREAEQANIAKSRFLATMSHELRTPLNAIIGFSEVMSSEVLGPMENPSYKEYSADIHASGQHLLNLINELLDLSRIEAGKYELNEEAISLVNIAEDCRRMLEIRARSKGIELVADFDEKLPKLWGDERAIRQVCLNLLSNAIKFTPQSGRIIFKVASGENNCQMISVRDNGPGIPENEIATVLSSFGQGSLAQKTAEQGAGLGLPIVQKIMELHGGRFDLFSKLRFGTEVIATFPRSRVMEAMAPVRGERRKLQIYKTASEG